MGINSLFLSLCQVLRGASDGAAFGLIKYGVCEACFREICVYEYGV